MKSPQKIKKELRERRRARVRAKIFGRADRPRLNVFRSLKHLYLQLIDDEEKKTIVSASDREVKNKKELKKADIAFKVGELLAKKAVAVGIKAVIFNRGSYKYHGQVKAVADGARKGGLKF